MRSKKPEGEPGSRVGMEPSAVLCPMTDYEFQSGFTAIETTMITFQVEAFVSMERLTRTVRFRLPGLSFWPVSFYFRVR